MKKYIPLLPIAILILCLFTPNVARSQDAGKDKFTILTEPFNQRPINVHKGQFQINTGYEMSVRTKTFDETGSIIGLVEDGAASIQHSYIMNIRYGILEFLEVSAELNFSKKGIREPTQNFLSGASAVTVNRLNEYNGFEDLLLSASLSLPFDNDLLDFALSGGIWLPTSKNEPDRPSHTYNYLGVGSYVFNLQYNNNNGIGVPVWRAGADLQLSLSKVTITSSASFSSPTGEAESVIWNEFFEDGDFVYNSQAYNYLPQENLEIYADLHYQAISWLDIYMGFMHFESSGGWFTQDENKYSIPENKLNRIHAGFEIQVSPLVRLSESAGFTIGGQNTDAPFSILTSLSFNLIPF